LLGTGIYSAVQAWNAVGTANRSAAAAIDAVAQARRAADAAISQANVSADIEKRSLRAYISWWPTGTGITVEDTEISAVVVMKNSGQTPAYNVQGRIFIISGPITLPQRAPCLGAQAIPNDAKVVISPISSSGTVGPSATFVFRLIVNPPDIAEVRNRHHVALVGGRVDYNDTFGDRRFIDYCFVAAPKPTTKIEGEAWGLQPALKGNDSN
jgi:hypothetical protein